MCGRFLGLRWWPVKSPRAGKGASSIAGLTSMITGLRKRSGSVVGGTWRRNVAIGLSIDDQPLVLMSGA